ncbi:hypothetical protein [Anabaena azotica]|uniref:hypothetical protein n=1 Tax=Anabaena azotica TaxID=197653 RepID=UPI0039A6AF80
MNFQKTVNTVYWQFSQPRLSDLHLSQLTNTNTFNQSQYSIVSYLLTKQAEATNAPVV